MRFSTLEPTDAEILSAAASIRSKLRKHHGGGRPCRKHSCPWCSAECVGKVALIAHQRDCDKSPYAALWRELTVSVAPLRMD